MLNVHTNTTLKIFPFFSAHVGGQKRDETHVVQDINQSPS